MNPTSLIKSLLAATVVAVPTSLPLVSASSDPVRVDARLDRPAVFADHDGRVVVQIEILPEELSSAKERPPVNLALVLDRSGSMSGGKINQAVAAARTAVRLLGPRDIISVVIYDDRTETLAEAGPADAEYRETIRERLGRVVPRGHTAIYDGLNHAAAELRKFAREGYVNRMVLLSDGLANRGPSTPSDFERLARALAGEDFIVSTVGLGLGFNEDIMTVLASAGQGNTYFAENADDLTWIFERELGDLLSVAATDVEITVRSREGVRLLRGIGREAEMEADSTARFHIPQFFGGMKKLALLEVSVPARPDGVELDLVDIEVAYRLGGEGGILRKQIVVPVRYEARAEKVAALVEDEVVANVALNRIAESKAQAISYADAGENRRAAKTLRETVDDLRSEYDSFGASVAVEEPAAGIDEDAAEIEDRGLSNRARKQYRTDSYQTVNQQAPDSP